MPTVKFPCFREQYKKPHVANLENTKLIEVVLVKVHFYPET